MWTDDPFIIFVQVFVLICVKEKTDVEFTSEWNQEDSLEITHNVIVCQGTSIPTGLAVS